jgi:hypothetical protein
MRESWLRLEEFPDYGVSNFGEIANLKRDRIIRPFVTQQGNLGVTLRRNRERYSRSVSHLVAETFLPDHPSHYNSPLHLNADKLNCQLNNLVWRPRNFTGRYYEQFEWEWFHESAVPLLNLTTREEFEGYKEPCVNYGIRAVEIIMSDSNDSKVFPTWHKYRLL